MTYRELLAWLEKRRELLGDDFDDTPVMILQKQPDDTLKVTAAKRWTALGFLRIDDAE